MTKVRVVSATMTQLTKTVYWCEPCERALAFYRKGGHPCTNCKADMQDIGWYEAPVGEAR